MYCSCNICTSKYNLPDMELTIYDMILMNIPIL